LNAGTKLACAVALSVMPRTLPAQGILDQFTYEGLRLSGIGIEVGSVRSNRLNAVVTPALRIDVGFIAPRLRVLVGLSGFRGEFRAQEITRFADRLRRLVIDPTGDFTIAVGTIRWTNVVADLDFQYLADAGVVTPYLGAGAGIHFRDGSGPAIDGTFVEDALDTFAAGVNVTAGLMVAVTRGLQLTGELRGTLTSELRTLAARAGLAIRLPKGAAG